MFHSIFVRRPGLGRQGHRVNVRTNYFEVTALPNAYIHHYDVVITPEVPPNLKRMILDKAEQLFLGSDFGNIKPIFDGNRNIFTPRPFPFGNFSTFEVPLLEDTLDSRIPSRFKIRIKKVSQIDIREINLFINGLCPISNNMIAGIMALNVLIHQIPSMIYDKIGKVFYNNQDSLSICGGIEVWQGYFHSIRPMTRRMMVNIDLHATTYYENGNLVQLVVKILNKRSVDDLRRLSDKDCSKLRKFLKKLKIYFTHRGASVNRFRIVELTSTSASDTKINVNGQQIDVASYFQRVFNRCLQYPFLPCVIVRNNFLPMEVCDVAMGQHYMHNLNIIQVADMLKFSCQTPNVRANKITQGPNILAYRQNEYMRQFGLQVSTEMVTVEARLLSPPRLTYHPSSRVVSFTPTNGSWDLRGKKVVSGATLGSWACVVFKNQRDYPIHVVHCFLRELITTCRDTGMNITNMSPPVHYFNPQGEIESSLSHSWISAGNAARARPQLILCILPNFGSLYAEIKRVCDTVIGVASQCILTRQTSRINRQLMANICLKINVKLGGLNLFIEPSQIPFINERPSILIGSFVNHPSSGSDRPSIAALCASMDASASYYATSIRFQASRQEIISDITGMVKELLKTFNSTCKKKPERILFYRNGISDDQFYMVLEHEVKGIIAACQALEKTYKPRITFIVVQRRHHTRFFPKDRESSDSSGNCPPGTVVEKTIVHPSNFDFYLQSHSSIRGTSRPSHYHVLYDENRFNPDSLQTLTYNLCYNVARCVRAAPIVPPLYYARLVCRRTRLYETNGNWNEDPEFMNYGIVKPDLQTVMYFI